jgi:hypothetical protein
VLNLSNPPVVIDEPGLYAIDRDWVIPDTTTAVVPELIQITADDVSLDLHGFKIIAVPPDFSSTTLFVITGSGTEIRNGGFEAGGDGGTAVRSTRGVGLHHVSVSSGGTMTFAGATITDSHLGSRLEMRFEGGSRLERNSIGCSRGLRCIRFLGDDSEFKGNRLSMSQGGGIEVVGDGNTVANNFIDLSDDVDGETVFDIKGDNNVVRDNTALVGNGSIGDPLWAISGTANTLDGNVAAPGRFGERARTGMAFTADGNFYGDNRMAAQTPFVVGGTVQTDWGGNVGY